MKKLIELHEEWCENHELPNLGLCGSIPKQYKDTLDVLRPTMEDKLELEQKGMSNVFWASGLNPRDFHKNTSYTPLRQTIVLLICAMHDEI